MNREEIMYCLNHGKSKRWICKEFEISYYALTKFIYDNNLRYKRNYKTSYLEREVDKIKELFASGMTIKEVATEMDCSLSWIKAIKKKYGIQNLNKFPSKK